VLGYNYIQLTTYIFPRFIDRSYRYHCASVASRYNIWKIYIQFVRFKTLRAALRNRERPVKAENREDRAVVDKLNSLTIG